MNDHPSALSSASILAVFTLLGCPSVTEQPEVRKLSAESPRTSVVRPTSDEEAKATPTENTKDNKETNKIVEAAKDYQRTSAIKESQGDLSEAAADAYQAFIQYYTISRYQEALTLVERARTLAKKAKNQRLYKRTHLGLFAALWDLGDLTAARRVIDDLETLADEKDDWVFASIYTDRGLLYERQGQFELARKLQLKALEHALRADFNVFQIRSNLIQALLKLEQFEDAAQYYKNAIDDLEVGDDPMKFLPLPLHYARILLGQGRVKQARDYLSAAIQKNKNSPDWRWNLQYWHGVALQRLGHQDLAAQAFERSIRSVEGIANGIRDMDFQSLAHGGRRRPYEALFVQNATAKDELGALAVIERAKGRTFLQAFVRSSLGWTNPRSDDVIVAAKARAAELARLLPYLRQHEAADAPALGRSLRNVNAMLYFRTEESMWVVAFRGGQIQTRQLPLPARQLSRLADDFFANLEDDKLAERVGGAFVPVDLLPPKGDTLFIVPDDLVATIPLAASIVDGRRLIERHAISYVPNLTVIATDASASSPANDVAPAVVMAYGAGLSYAKVEAETVARILRVAPAIGPLATRDVLRGAATSGALHIAAHAGPTEDGLALQLADGPVQPSEILAWRLRPRLAVLASCVSAVPRSRDLWGSLATAFLASGTRSVIGSLWSVEDESTSDLMRRFYAYYDAGARTPTQALAATQRELIRKRQPVSRWAPFVHLGWRTDGTRR